MLELLTSDTPNGWKAAILLVPTPPGAEGMAENTPRQSKNVLA